MNDQHVQRPLGIRGLLTRPYHRTVGPNDDIPQTERSGEAKNY
jgi:hypothetical protein